jgi:hypothetical protein
VFLEQPVEKPNKYVQGYTAERVFNLEEVGISDWKDHKTRKVVAPVTIRHSISRKVKHISMITCVCVLRKVLTTECFQAMAEIRIAFRRRERDREIHHEGIGVSKNNSS